MMAKAVPVIAFLLDLPYFLGNVRYIILSDFRFFTSESIFDFEPQFSSSPEYGIHSTRTSSSRRKAVEATRPPPAEPIPMPCRAAQFPFPRPWLWACMPFLSIGFPRGTTVERGGISDASVDDAFGGHVGKITQGSYRYRDRENLPLLLSAPAPRQQRIASLRFDTVGPG